MSDGGVVRSDSIVKVHSDVVEAIRNELYDGDKPGGGAGSALRHAKPVIESAGCAEGGQGDSVRAYG